MGSKLHKVELFFDVVSPYAWLGFETILRYEQRWKLDLHLRGVFLGGLMKETGNRAPAAVPAKGKYLLVDVEHSGRVCGVQLKPSEETMQLVLGEGSLLPMRFVTALDMQKETLGLTRGCLETVCRRFWTRLWTDTESIAQPENVTQVARDAGLDGATIVELLNAANSDPAKNRLRQTTNEALESGAFGVPWFRVKRGGDGAETVFFGSDRLEQMGHFLGEHYEGYNPDKKNPLNRSKL